MEGTFPPSWYALLVIAGLIGAIGILTNSQILIVGAMVVGPEYGAIISLAFGVTAMTARGCCVARPRWSPVSLSRWLPRSCCPWSSGQLGLSPGPALWGSARSPT